MNSKRESWIALLHRKLLMLIISLEEIFAFSSVSLEVLVMVNSSFAFCIKLICCNEKYLSHTCSLKRIRNGYVSV